MKKENQIKLLIGLNVLFLILTIITDALYINLGRAYTFKTLASITFVVWSLINLVLMFAFKNTLNKKFMIFMFIGQIFALIGDILLIEENTFILGAAFFAMGHIMFFIAYLFLQKFKLCDLLFVVGTILISITVIFISNIELIGTSKLIFVYAIIISAMVGKSLTLFKGNKFVASTILIGSLMFFLSDMFLMFNIFGNFGSIFGKLCLIFYYPAEFILASSIGVVGLFSSKKGKN